MQKSILVPAWADMHLHLREIDTLIIYLTELLKSGCTSFVAMPNLADPLTTLEKLTHYKNAILAQAPQLNPENVIVPLYLSKKTTWQMIEQGAKSGQLKAVKYYPPHGTTNAEQGVPMDHLLKEKSILQAMSDHGIVFCVHGEYHGLTGEHYFGKRENAETHFYSSYMEALIQQIPGLKIVCEHITTKTAAMFVKTYSHKHQVAATITPQHLLFTIADLLQGFQADLHCLPFLKFDEDREALRNLAFSGKSNVFAGTDSAPHSFRKKRAPYKPLETPCGCAAGCYTGRYGAQLYAMAFGLDKMLSGEHPWHQETVDAFSRFISSNGRDFYGLPEPKGTIELVLEPCKVEHTLLPEAEGLTEEDRVITPVPLAVGWKTLPLSLRLNAARA